MRDSFPRAERQCHQNTEYFQKKKDLLIYLFKSGREKENKRTGGVFLVSHMAAEAKALGLASIAFPGPASELGLQPALPPHHNRSQ